MSTLQVKILLGFISIVFFLGTIDGKQCIKTKVGQNCSEDHDCFEQNELHLYCNKTDGVNVCGFHFETYIGHATKNVDCEGAEFSAEKWSNPLSQEVPIDNGLDCMRVCLHVQTCFGVTIYDKACYLKNEKCFDNLKKRPGAIIGVLNVIREDYKCGCHYPFTRKKSDGVVLIWNPECPENQLTRNPFRCCSERGLCVECGSQSQQSQPESHATAAPEGSAESYRNLLQKYAKFNA